jgi:type 1 fimbria pilin
VTSGGLAAFSKSMRNAVLGAVLMLLTAACGAYEFPGSSQSGVGTVTGTVMAMPCAPVESGTNPCMGRPAPGVEIDFTNGSGTSRTVTDSKGSYSINLGAGTWKVTLTGFMRVISGPPTVTLAPGARVVANYFVDSGIRVPVPQP